MVSNNESTKRIVHEKHERHEQDMLLFVFFVPFVDFIFAYAQILDAMFFLRNHIRGRVDAAAEDGFR